MKAVEEAGHALPDSTGKVLEIERSRIRSFPGQPRRYFDESELKELAESIAAIGQQVPIMVSPVEGDPDHGFELVDGERRFKACGLAGVEKMLAWIIPKDILGDQFVKSVISNFGRAGHTPLETTWAIQRILQRTKDVKQVAKIFARSTAWVYQHLSLVNLHDDAQKLMHPARPPEERLTLPIALLLAPLPGILQAELAKDVVDRKMSTAQARHYIRGQARRKGYQTGSQKRSPDDDYQIFLHFAERVVKQSEILLDTSPEEFRRMFDSRSSRESRDLCIDLRQGIKNLTSLLETLESIERMK